MVWDIQRNKLVGDYDSLKFVQWPDWSLSSSINGRYIDKSCNRGTDEEEKKKYILESATITNVARFTRFDNAIMGSNIGELFAIRFAALQLQKASIVEFRHDRVYKRDMAMSKVFDALTSMI